MPRFFFNIHDGVDFIDDTGTVLPGWREAQVEAIRLAGAMIVDGAKIIKLGEDWRLEVLDEAGLILFRLDFHIASSPATGACLLSQD